MKAATPDAYRVDAGADTRDYPGGVATRLSEQPTLPGRYSGPAAPTSVDTAPTSVIRRTRTHAPTPKPATVVEGPRAGAIAPAVERTVIAVVPPRGQAASAHAPAQGAAPRTTSAPEPRHPAPAQGASPRTTSAPELRHPAPAAARPAAESAAVRSVEPAVAESAEPAAARSVESAAAPRPADADAAPAAPASRFAPDADLTADQRSFAPRPQAAPAREYAHFDEPVVSGFDRPQDEESDFSVSEGDRGVPSRADVALSRRAAHAHRLVSADQEYTRASEPQGRGLGDALASGSDNESVDRLPLRRDLPRRKKRSHRGLVMFLLGFLVAIVLVLGAAVALYYLRFAGAQNFSSALDTCHASGSYVRLAADKSSLTLQAENESGRGLSAPVFRCVLDELDAPASMRQRMLLTRAIDGTQEEQWGLYRATWTYHPDQGLNVVISAR
ncbi:hypothetical protein [Actinomyces sp.]|uniref:hypothetical protein n=1 Tax=Actinomyces sp. TaxID=29317 RepID=UPI0025C59ECB|nr:hypothetical protein [Actinomyces sp.]